MSIYEIKQKQLKRKRIRRKRGILGSICFIVGLVVVWLLLCGTSADRQAVGYEYKQCSCLWELTDACPNNMDKRKYINEVMKLNGMDDCTVYAGRIYQVPVYVD